MLSGGGLICIKIRSFGLAGALGTLLGPRPRPRFLCAAGPEDGAEDIYFLQTKNMRDVIMKIYFLDQDIYEVIGKNPMEVNTPDIDAIQRWFLV